MRRVLVLVLEGLLLLTVLATAGYYMALAFDDGQTFNMRLLGGWIAALLVVLSFFPLVSRRLAARGTQEASDATGLIQLGIIGLVMLTMIGVGMDAKKSGPTFGHFYPLALFFVMFFWPDLRHRIRTGAWRD